MYLVLSMPRAYSWMVARSRHKRERGFLPLLTPLSFRIRLTPCFEDTAVMKEYLRSSSVARLKAPHDTHDWARGVIVPGVGGNNADAAAANNVHRVISSPYVRAVFLKHCVRHLHLATS